MKLKRMFLVLMTLLAVGMTIHGVHAQPQDKRSKEVMQQQIESLRVAHITSEVGLTPQESAVFWPIYNKYWSEHRENMKRLHDTYHSAASQQELTATQAQADIDQILLCRRHSVELTDKLVRELSGVLTPEKILKVFAAENSFKRVVLNKTRGQR